MKSALVKLLLIKFLLLLTTPVWGQGYLENYNPAKGFGKPDKSLTTIFLKLAGSLEHHGSPEPYIRWMMARYDEHETKQKAKGKAGVVRPVYLTQDYAEGLIESWKTMEPHLKLKTLTHDCGRYMRLAIRGSWHKTGEDWAIEEPKLKGEARKQFVQLAGKGFLTKADFSLLEQFYADGHEDLSAPAKAHLSTLVFRGRMSEEKLERELAILKGGTKIVALLNKYQDEWPKSARIQDGKGISSENLQNLIIEHLQLDGPMPALDDRPWDDKDSVRYAHEIRELFVNRFEILDEHVGGTGAPKFKKDLRLMYENLLVLAHSELNLSTFR